MYEEDKSRLSVHEIINLKEVGNVEEDKEILKEEVKNQDGDHKPDVPHSSQVEDVGLSVYLHVSEIANQGKRLSRLSIIKQHKVISCIDSQGWQWVQKRHTERNVMIVFILMAVD